MMHTPTPVIYITIQKYRDVIKHRIGFQNAVTGVRSDVVEQFMKELKELCEKHNLTINWDEHREEFCVENVDEYGSNLRWLLCAYDNIKR